MGVVLVVILVILPAYLVIRWSGKANGWIYETLREFFNEALQGHKFQNTLSRVLALIGSIVVVVLIIILISAL